MLAARLINYRHDSRGTINLKKKNNFHLMVSRRISIFLIIVSTVLGLTYPIWQVQANGLPPRGQPPNGTPDKPHKTDEDTDDGPIGSHIELQTQPVTAGLWGVVQWQDQQGDWHNVEGWQGTLNSTGTQRWWVEQKDFATGPFRWIVMSAQNGTIRGTSQLFDLPIGADQTLLIVVLLE